MSIAVSTPVLTVVLAVFSHIAGVISGWMLSIHSAEKRIVKALTARLDAVKVDIKADVQAAEKKI